MSQPPQPPPPGTVVNGYQWDGRQWVQLPQVGQVVNGHQWDGRQWVPLPQVGQVVNGHQWDGRQWVPLPQVGQVVNGHQWDGRQWVPLAAQPAAPLAATPAANQAGAAASSHEWILAELGRLAQAWQFEWRQKADRVILRRVVAEQKSFMATAKLEYEAQVRVDDARREVHFVELLREARSGMNAGGVDDDFGPSGFGVQRSSYNTAKDTVQDNIDQQAALYRTRYGLDFRYDLVRQQVSGIAAAAGYAFSYGALS